MTKSLMWDHKITSKKLAYRSGHSTDISEHNTGNRNKKKRRRKKEEEKQSTANKTQSTVNTIQSIANTIQSTANTTQSTANTTQSPANTTQSTLTVKSKDNSQQRTQHSSNYNTVNSNTTQSTAGTTKSRPSLISRSQFLRLIYLQLTHILNPVLSRRIQYTIRTQVISTQELCPVYHDAAYSHIFWSPLKFCEHSKGKPA